MDLELIGKFVDHKDILINNLMVLFAFPGKLQCEYITVTIGDNFFRNEVQTTKLVSKMEK